MEKTIHINLGGLVFKIEEDAYNRLNNYLEKVKTRLGEGEEAREIIDDITLRIAEIFKGAHSEAGSAITMTQVEEVIKTMGTPEDYEISEDEPSNTTRPNDQSPFIHKRLFRDNDNRVIAGVCSGLGNYFGIDPIIFRLLFLVGLFYGISIIPYLILWIAVPKAITVQQRLLMMGGEQGQELWRKHKNTQMKVNRVFQRTLRVLAIITGIFLLVFSFLSLIGVTMTLSVSELIFGTIITEGAWIPELPALFLTREQTSMGLIGTGLLTGIPLLLLFYLGMHMVFRFKRGGAPLILTGLILWLTGLGLVTYSAVDTMHTFSYASSDTKTQMLESPASDTIYIKPSNTSMLLAQGRNIINSGEIKVRLNEGELMAIGNPHLKIVKGAESFKITIEKKARGRNLHDATDNISMIEYFYLKNDSALLLDRFFTLQDQARLRLQRVIIKVEVPHGKEVVVAPELQDLVD